MVYSLPLHSAGFIVAINFKRPNSKKNEMKRLHFKEWLPLPCHFGLIIEALVPEAILHLCIAPVLSWQLISSAQIQKNRNETLAFQGMASFALSFRPDIRTKGKMPPSTICDSVFAALRHSRFHI